MPPCPPASTSSCWPTASGPGGSASAPATGSSSRGSPATMRWRSSFAATSGWRRLPTLRTRSSSASTSARSWPPTCSRPTSCRGALRRTTAASSSWSPPSPLRAARRTRARRLPRSCTRSSRRTRPSWWRSSAATPPAARSWWRASTAPTCSTCSRACAARRWCIATRRPAACCARGRCAPSTSCWPPVTLPRKALSTTRRPSSAACCATPASWRPSRTPSSST
mmetsp:Transcript_11935/g.48076  ORF Transcript_11935/g.48076 Transcript_11935/m.48076 type:complete len:224 (+) Transcript_11935:1586-2257(+)